MTLSFAPLSHLMASGIPLFSPLRSHNYDPGTLTLGTEEELENITDETINEKQKAFLTKHISMQKLVAPSTALKGTRKSSSVIRWSL